MKAPALAWRSAAGLSITIMDDFGSNQNWTRARHSTSHFRVRIRVSQPIAVRSDDTDARARRPAVVDATLRAIQFASCVSEFIRNSGTHQPRSSGTGNDLAICKGIVERLRGRIQGEPEEGQGRSSCSRCGPIPRLPDQQSILLRKCAGGFGWLFLAHQRHTTRVPQ